MAVTVKDVAAEAGVNHATVSRALAGKPHVAEATRHRILEAAERVGYRVSTAARAVRTGRTGLIGMIQSAVGGRSVRAPLFHISVDQAIHAAGQCVVRDLIDEPALPGESEMRPPKVLREKVVDGLLINCVLGTPPDVRRSLERWEIPAIWINRKRVENCVRPDDEGAAREATRKLIEAGHREVTMTAVRRTHAIHQVEPHYSQRDRKEGYLQAMRQAGLQPAFAEIREPTERPARFGSILRGSVEFLNRPDRPTAVLCGSHGMEMVAAAWKLGLDVPTDLSVITFDNEVTNDSRIAVDRMLIRYDEMAHRAVRELLALIDDPKSPRPPAVIPLDYQSMGTISRPPQSDPSTKGQVQ